MHSELVDLTLLALPDHPEYPPIPAQNLPEAEPSIPDASPAQGLDYCDRERSKNHRRADAERYVAGGPDEFHLSGKPPSAAGQPRSGLVAGGSSSFHPQQIS